jgi:hypothetical protein
LLSFFLGEAKKGGNSVASMLWKLFHLKGLMNGRTANEINIVFDNCAGQNKNRMVYRMLFFMVKLKVCRTARAIFLVKGHTKNDCDRMFKLMKYDYRKVNCYTPVELLAIVNEHPQVQAIPMPTKAFNDWDTLENKMIGKITGGSLKKNHVFTVKWFDSNRMMIQEYAGAPIKKQLLDHPDFWEADWRPLFKLEKLKPSGLPDIKWNELYAKWGQFVPEDRKRGLLYFVQKPPPSLKKSIAEQSKAAKDARAKRTRGAGDIGAPKRVDHGDNTSSKPAAKKKKATMAKSTGKRTGRPTTKE